MPIVYINTSALVAPVTNSVANRVKFIMTSIEYIKFRVIVLSFHASHLVVRPEEELENNRGK